MNSPEGETPQAERTVPKSDDSENEFPKRGDPADRFPKREDAADRKSLYKTSTTPQIKFTQPKYKSKHQTYKAGHPKYIYSCIYITQHMLIRVRVKNLDFSDVSMFPHIWIFGHAETVPRHISRF